MVRSKDMANNYVQFAALFNFPKKACDEIISLADFLQNPSMEELDQHSWFFSQVGYEGNLLDELKNNPDDIESILSEAGIFDPNLIAERDDRTDSLYIASWQADLEITCIILQSSMRHNNIQEIITFEAAMFCDKLRVGEFGGISCAVSQDDYLVRTSYSSSIELKDQLENIKKSHMNLATQECLEIFELEINNIFNDAISANDNVQAKEKFCDGLYNMILEIINDDLKENGVESTLIHIAGKLDLIDYAKIFEKKLENCPNCFAGQALR